MTIKLTCIKNYPYIGTQYLLAQEQYEVDLSRSSCEFILILAKNSNCYIFSFEYMYGYPKLENYFIKPSNFEDVIKNYIILK